MDDDLHNGYEECPLGKQFVTSVLPFSLSATVGVMVLWDPSSVVTPTWPDQLRVWSAVG